MRSGELEGVLSVSFAVRVLSVGIYLKFLPEYERVFELGGGRLRIKSWTDTRPVSRQCQFNCDPA